MWILRNYIFKNTGPGVSASRRATTPPIPSSDVGVNERLLTDHESQAYRDADGESDRLVEIVLLKDGRVDRKADPSETGVTQRGCSRSTARPYESPSTQPPPPSPPSALNDTPTHHHRSSGDCGREETGEGYTPLLQKQRGAAARVWKWYLDALDERPIYTKVWTALVIGVFSDAAAQYLTYHGPVGAFNFDMKRLFMFSLVNALYGPPITHYWLNFLDTLVKTPLVSQRVSRGYPTVIFQLALDQLLCAPIVNAGFLVVLYLSQALAAGTPLPISATLRDVGRRLAKEYWPVLSGNWKLWPFANFVNFAFVPLPLRVLFVNVVAVGWTIFISASVNS